MIRAPLSTTSVLDEAADVVSLTAAPWAGLLMATSLPYRFLQALFLDQLIEVGADAARYGNLLGATANMTVLTIVLAFWGRAVYARACRIAASRGTTPGRETWRVPAAALASYILTASAATLLGYVALFTIAGFVVAVLVAGLAVGTLELNERVSLTRPFALIVRYSNRLGTLFALLFVLFCGAVVALVNLATAFQIGTWLAGAVAGFDAPKWQLLFTPGNRRFALMLAAGALVLVEPFWIAAHVVYVRKAGAEESGDDLRAWFEELRGAA
ncbi:MAG TPA: hypothetical protein VGF28_17560 [Thermoanaerobaculia bacterium]